MAVTEAKLSPEAITFTAAAREDTGRHLLDSGGAYGRHHEAEELEGAPIVRLEASKWGPEATIETGPFLDEWFDIDRELQAAFADYAAERRGSWFDLGRDFMEGQGYELRGRDNVYNGEQDLSQVFIFEVWDGPEARGDWFYADMDRRTVIYLHTGCDVRGGYGRPIFGESADGEYSVPADLVVGWQAVEGRAPDGRPLSRSELQELDREWQVGWSSAPTYELGEDVKRTFTWLADDATVPVLLEGGEVVKVLAYCRGPQGTIWHGGEVRP